MGERTAGKTDTLDQPVEASQARLIAQLEALVSQTRHDIRSALTPAMLAADLMRANEDPRVQRSGEVVVAAVERTLKILKATRDVVPPKAAQPHRP
jgi:signal transduction histidine kinase